MQCTRRQCPICLDHRYVKDGARDASDDVLTWVRAILEDGGLYNAKKRSLKIYSFIYSPVGNNLRQERKNLSRHLQGAGYIGGIAVVHPFRGPHKKGDTGSVIRESMDLSKPSLHFHGIGIGYWTDQTKKGAGYVLKNRKIMDVRSLTNDGVMLYLRNKLENQMQYNLNHAGYIGKGQCTSRFGTHPSRKCIELNNPDWKPGTIASVYQDPDTGDWEPRSPLDCDPAEITKALQYFSSDEDFFNQNWEGMTASFPRGGQRVDGEIGGWFRISEIEVLPNHNEWIPWIHETLSLIAAQLK
jgi:hypothetical protein